MILGVGVDVCDIGRFEATLRRTPEVAVRLFTPAERTLPTPSLAARFAAKEALAKALGVPPGLEWHDVQVVPEPSGRPVLELRGTLQAAAEGVGVRDVHLSLSHDAGIATAFVVLEG